MFIEALFTTAKLRKQSDVLQLINRLRKCVYIYTIEYYLATKKNEITSFADKWMELGMITPSKVSQVQKNEDHIFSLTCGR
jgi:hypothetical protein